MTRVHIRSDLCPRSNEAPGQKNQKALVRICEMPSRLFCQERNAAYSLAPDC